MSNVSMTPVRRIAIPLILMAAVLVTGCGGGEQDEQATTNQETVSQLTPDQEAMVLKAVTIANAIAVAPATMVKVLADNGLTADEYQSLIYRISADPALAQAYQDARK